jgi:hypothetical protein
MLRHRSLRLVVLALVVSLPLLGTSAGASAKAKGCHRTHSCKSVGGSGGGTGGAPAPITVQIDPNPLVETGSSDVAAVIQVETSPSFAGDLVNVSSSQLQAACGGIIGFLNNNVAGTDNVQITLDNGGNATVVVTGTDCAPGPSVVEADLVVAPFLTALTTLDARPPVVTPAGVTGYPTTSGTVTTGEVETGDTAASGDSDVYAVFYVETDPVYAEQPVEINSAQLQSRCLRGSALSSVLNGTNQSILDNDGNAVFTFFGRSCAAGSSQVIADVLAGTHQTYTTTFNINPPQPTI